MTRGSERESVFFTDRSGPNFALKLTLAELCDLRCRAERELDIFGAGARISVRASDIVSFVTDLIKIREKDGQREK